MEKHTSPKLVVAVVVVLLFYFYFISLANII